MQWLRNKMSSMDLQGLIITNPTNPTDPDCPDCTEARRLYEELMRQLDELKRQNPECY